MANGIWIHQFDQLSETSWDAIRAKWPGRVYVKALDGIHFQDEFDISQLAVDSEVGRSAGNEWFWKEKNAIPWIVVTGEDAPHEGSLAARIRNSSDDLFLDLEPYQHFWRGSDEDAQTYISNFTRETIQAFAVTLDYRRLPFPPEPFWQVVGAILPQVYWTTFQKPWRDVLEEAFAALSTYDKPAEYILPGDADPQDLKDAIAWCDERQIGYSIWAWHTITEANWETILGHSSPPVSSGPTQADLVNLLGYLQGDVADAIASPLNAIRAGVPIDQVDGRIAAAMAAVDTLRKAGKS